MRSDGLLARGAAVGVHRITASTSSRASASARSVAACAAPYLSGDLLGLLEPAADHRRDRHTLHRGKGVQVLDAEGSGTCECDPHGSSRLPVVSGSWTSLGSGARPEDEVSDGCVGSWHVVEAVELLDVELADAPLA